MWKQVEMSDQQKISHGFALTFWIDEEHSDYMTGKIIVHDGVLEYRERFPEEITIPGSVDGEEAELVILFDEVPEGDLWEAVYRKKWDRWELMGKNWED